MKIIVDENIAYGEEAFSEFGKVQLFHGRKINNEILKDVDVLIIRSVTKVTEELLAHTNVKFVGTTTIGTDHIDKNYLDKSGIVYANAPGCNSFAVAEYVATSLINAAVSKNISLKNKSLGIIGYGNIGTKVARFAELFGMKTLLNDPPLEKTSGKNQFTSFENALSCDAVTFHVPLNKAGNYKTVHLLNKNNIGLIKQDSILINTSRGKVTDNKAVLEKLKENENIFSVFDVWENEPEINIDLLNAVNIATSHIAGYSLEGKVNGTAAIHYALAKFLNISAKWKPNLPKVKNPLINVDVQEPFEQILNKILQIVYPQYEDDLLLRKSIDMNTAERKKYFDGLRKNYRLRREFTNYTIKLNKPDAEIKRKLEGLRFVVV